jgi:hypothetical protein
MESNYFIHQNFLFYFMRIMDFFSFLVHSKFWIYVICFFNVIYIVNKIKSCKNIRRMFYVKI